MQTVHHSAAHHTHSVLYDSPGRAHHMYTADCQQPLSLRSCLNSKTSVLAYWASWDPGEAWSGRRSFRQRVGG